MSFSLSPAALKPESRKDLLLIVFGVMLGTMLSSILTYTLAEKEKHDWYRQEFQYGYDKCQAEHGQF